MAPKFVPPTLGNIWCALNRDFAKGAVPLKYRNWYRLARQGNEECLFKLGMMASDPISKEWTHFWTEYAAIKNLFELDELWAQECFFVALRRSMLASRTEM